MDRCFVMTVDVDPPSPMIPRVNIEKGVRGLVDLFDSHKIDATFFITASIGQKFPGAIEEICGRNHEIACHGLDHVGYECLRSEEEQRKRIEMATDIITSVTGQKPLGFRAPAFRLNRACLDILRENDYVYDSSIVPTYLPGAYGHPFAPPKPYTLINNSKRRSTDLVELPVSINPLIPLPLGGAWMRTLGTTWTKLGVKMNFIFGRCVIFYVHPKDVIHSAMEMGAPWYYYRNIQFGMEMLKDLIEYVKKENGCFRKAIDVVKSFILENC